MNKSSTLSRLIAASESFKATEFSPQSVCSNHVSSLLLRIQNFSKGFGEEFVMDFKPLGSSLL
ncbi:hypothetical protein [Rhizobium sp. CCGE 510]|uniref:hypothetical protein n=1 Tax=Rhizobium sp. CCGE 510 TaxID=1132836 RepID=UPI00027B7D7A|nr:hypothetical protein [Rhizobium sp. CCGE 510]EJT00870.1 hypothetical protein RCCGE510_32921 [Rhizobium sp. CCGE 510]